jgi:hypothetical protein
MMGGGKIGQRNSNRRFEVTSELRNATVVAEQAGAMVDSAGHLDTAVAKAGRMTL